MSTSSSPAIPAGPPGDGGSRVVVQYGKFFLVGLTGFVVNLIVFTLVLEALSPGSSSGFFGSITRFLTHTTANPGLVLLASAVAFVVATFWNFLLNSVWTFRARRGHRHSRPRRLALYFAVSLASLGVNEVVLYVTTSSLPPLYGQAIGILAGSVVGFFGNARITFAEVEAEERTSMNQATTR